MGDRSRKESRTKNKEKRLLKNEVLRWKIEVEKNQEPRERK